MTMVEPLPGETVPPGYRVRVQDPTDGKPVNSTLPVASMHVGEVTVPTTGDDGIEGWVFTTALTDEGDTHPAELVTVNV